MDCCQRRNKNYRRTQLLNHWCSLPHSRQPHTRMFCKPRLVFGMRPQGEGKGIQASVLVPITRLKPQGSTSPGERRNRPLLSAWGLRLTHKNIAVAILAKAPDLSTMHATQKHESLRLKGYRSSWMCGMKSTTQTFHAARAYCSSCTFPSCQLRSLSPKLPVPEAVAPRYAWEKETTAQSPFRCSDVLP